VRRASARRSASPRSWVTALPSRSPEWAVGQRDPDRNTGCIHRRDRPGAFEDVGVFRKEPQRSIGEPVDLLDPETNDSIAAAVSWSGRRLAA
jgi:hypothetical protein